MLKNHIQVENILYIVIILHNITLFIVKEIIKINKKSLDEHIYIYLYKYRLY